MRKTIVGLGGLLTLALFSVIEPACQDPTQIVVTLSTNLSCGGAAPSFESGQLSVLRDKTPVDGSDVEIPKSQCAAGSIGSMTIVPGPAGLDGTVRISAAAWLGTNVPNGTAADARACIATPSAPNCVVSTRSIKFFRHQSLSIPIFLDSACAGKTCPTGQTCGAGGKCISEEIIDQDAGSDSGAEAGDPLLVATKIWAGGNSTCALLTDGKSVACWGDSTAGQLGAKAPIAPTVVTELANAKALGIGSNHLCALVPGVTSPVLRCWGSHLDLQLGDGKPDGTTGTVLRGVDPTWRTTLGVGANHACAVYRAPQSAEDATVCWGRALEGQIDGTTVKPAKLPTPVNTTFPPSQIVAGDTFTCALTQTPTCNFVPPCDGPVICWGDNTNGQIGQVAKSPTFFAPTRLQADPVANTDLLAAGARHVLARSDGKIWGWGDASLGQLGASVKSTFNGGPVEIAELSGATALAAGDAYSCGILGGTVACVGAFASIDFSALKSDGSAIAIAGGRSHACALTKSGHVYCWGASKLLQLGGGVGPAASGVVAPL